jgi:hypothetical protein
VKANPLKEIDTLKDVRFVLKDGRDGVQARRRDDARKSSFNSGPVNGWRIH